MSSEAPRQQVLRYLYGDLDQAEWAAFEADLKRDPGLTVLLYAEQRFDQLLPVSHGRQAPEALLQECRLLLRARVQSIPAPLAWSAGMAAAPAVQTALPTALQGDMEPGTRLQAPDLARHQAGSERIREALIHTLAHDDNPGLLRKAIEALRDLASDEEVRQALSATSTPGCGWRRAKPSSTSATRLPSRCWSSRAGAMQTPT